MQHIELIKVEDYPCDTLLEAKQRERWWIDNKGFKELHKTTPSRTQQEFERSYRERKKELMKQKIQQNPEFYKQKAKEHYQKHKEYESERHKKYYNENKEEFMNKYHKEKDEINKKRRERYAINKDKINEKRRAKSAEKKSKPIGNGNSA